MTQSPKRPFTGNGDVGYGKPPSHSRFQKGRSGNPGGRPRGATAQSASDLFLKEAYRLIKVREGERVFRMPGIRAIARQLIATGLKGKSVVARAVVQTVHAFEKERSARAAAFETAEKPKESPMSELELARRIAFLLERGARAAEAQQSTPPITERKTGDE